MTSRKPSAKARQKAEFECELFDGGDVFEKEERWQEERYAQREENLRIRACESKNRYVCRSDAEEAIAKCSEYGTRELKCYKCKYCNGWHLTSKSY